MKFTKQDLSLQLMDVVKEQQKTIDKLTDKLMAKSFEEYKSLNDDTVPSVEKKLKEDPSVNFMDAEPTDLMKALNEE